VRSSRHCACGAVPRFHSLCRWPLAVPRMEYAVARLRFSARHLHIATAATANVCLCFIFLSPCSRMSSETFWSNACRNAVDRQLPTLLVALRGSCGVTVRRPPLPPLGSCLAHVCVERAAAFACNAFLSLRLRRIV
jgi:hypothetical protein